MMSLLNKLSIQFSVVIINSTLTWEDHIKTACDKVSKSIGNLVRIRSKLTDILQTIYLTLIQPYIQGFIRPLLFLNYYTTCYS